MHKIFQTKIGTIPQQNPINPQISILPQPINNKAYLQQSYNPEKKNNPTFPTLLLYKIYQKFKAVTSPKKNKMLNFNGSLKKKTHKETPFPLLPPNQACKNPGDKSMFMKEELPLPHYNIIFWPRDESASNYKILREPSPLHQKESEKNKNKK